MTHQLLDNRNSCATVIQSLRILGNHNDNIPLKLYTTPECASQIRKGTLLTDKLVKSIKTDFPKELTHQAIKKVPISVSEKPRKYLTRKAETKALKIVPDVKEEAKEGVQEQENWILKIIPSSLNNKEKEIYEKLSLHLYMEFPNIWVRRTVMVALIGGNEDASRARMKDMCLLSGKQENVRDENERGLLFKKENDLWHIRYNK